MIDFTIFYYLNIHTSTELKKNILYHVKVSALHICLDYYAIENIDVTFCLLIRSKEAFKTMLKHHVFIFFNTFYDKKGEKTRVFTKRKEVKIYTAITFIYNLDPS